ncbi:hypothetical protein IFM89_015900 [Coptis chinensis]|uniref:RNase H type-1 domain-containing protein n=1 Tax=Coptis chinensis TaxID=261450 RepID=A0A835HV49_9MAGN|nr:hypothetical protein IFM89_015900 [Coptis chinensis]
MLYFKGCQVDILEDDNVILSKWRIPARHIRHQVVRQCTWELPECDTIKVNCDTGECWPWRIPGNAGLGVVYRNSSGDFMLVMWRKLGINTNYLAECLAILEGIECAVQRGWCKLWVESDPEAAIPAFGIGNLPWHHFREYHQYNPVSVGSPRVLISIAINAAGASRTHAFRKNSIGSGSMEATHVRTRWYIYVYWIRHKKSIDGQVSVPGDVPTSHQPAIDKLDLEFIKREKSRKELSLADQIRVAKKKRAESAKKEELAKISSNLIMDSRVEELVCNVQ